MMCIYRITDLTNGKIYIGQTRNLKRRKKEYKSASNGISKKNQNYLICQMFAEKGFDNFVFDVLEEVNDSGLLDEKEIFWISKLDSRNPLIGYNSKTGGKGGSLIQESRDKMRQSSYGFHHTEEEKLKRSKPIITVDPKTNVIIHYRSMKDLGKDIGVNRAMVSHAVNRGILFHDRYVFPADKEERDLLYNKLKVKETGGHNARISFESYTSAYNLLTNDKV